MNEEAFNIDEAITPDNLENVDTEKIALNRERFGALVFETIFPKLEELKEIFVDFQKHSYQNLPEEQKNLVDSYLNSFVEKLNWLRQFNPAQSGDVNGEKSNFENQINDLHRSVFRELMPSLTYLRYRTISKRPEQKELAKFKNEAQNAKTEFQKISQDLKEKIATLEAQKEEVSRTKGEIAAKTTGKHFERQAKEHATEKAKWALQRERYFNILLGIIVAILIIYVILLLWGDVNKLFNIQFAVLKIAVIAILSYAVSFASKNYRINCHLESINMHRKNIAETLNDFISSNPTPEDRSAMMQSAVSAMFQHLSTGYDSQDPKKDNGPAHEIIQFIPKVKGPTDV